MIYDMIHLHLQADVIVDTVNMILDLRQGPVSAAILAEAGQSLQQECYRSLSGRNALTHWEYIQTGPGNLRCRKVYHISAANYDYFVSGQNKV